MLTGKSEPSKESEVFRIIPDTIYALKDHKFDSVGSVNNRADAKEAKKIINEIALKVLGLEFPIVYRRYWQNKVIYEIYMARYYVIINGKWEDTYDLMKEDKINVDFTDENPKWVEFKQEANKALGVSMF